MNNSFEVAIFPIPDLVVFPRTVLPLHVFEPRYRTMIEDSVRQERMIGVCHTKKQISSARKNQSIKEALSSNQATYEPVDVFSAGQCKITEKTKDGRIYVNISLQYRLRLIQEIQTLPYRICSCQILEDESADPSRLFQHQADIINLMRSIMEQEAPRELTKFDETAWLKLGPEEFSFDIFKIMRFPPDLMQSLLESTNTEKRLLLIKETLTNGLQNARK